ncbi:uncharacterized protein LOC122857839 isoform X2 [Aphidius gifuensis]|nr:uncharacterized protein LOC122857839 isoform X2 [Aphidius gifuensis]
MDPECNSFQNFLFDHPCIYVMKKDKDTYPIDALMTCNHALSVCQRGKPCFKLFEDFKSSCKTRDGKCRMESREACHDAWTQLRLSPMFGCICPGNQIKKRCDKIFSTVNHNPCIDYLPSSVSVDLSGTDSALYPYDPQQENFQEIWLPPTSMYPYFLFPATSRTYNDPNDNDRHRHGHYGLPEQPGIYGTIKNNQNNNYDTHQKKITDVNHNKLNNINKQQLYYPDNKNIGLERDNNNYYPLLVSSSSAPYYFSTISTIFSTSLPNYPKHERDPVQRQSINPYEHDNKNNMHNKLMHNRHDNYNYHDNYPNAPSNVENNNDPAQSAHQQFGTNVFAPRPIFNRINENDDDTLKNYYGLPIDQLFNLRKAFYGFVDQVKIISNPDNSTSYEVMESQLENPLIDTDHQDLYALKQLALPGLRHRPYHRQNHTDNQDDYINTGIDTDKTIFQPMKLVLTSTCHHAYQLCKNDSECQGLLQPVLNQCDLASCSRNECMNALQNFYKKANDLHSMEIAFCLCKKTQDKQDECITAQEKMHPVCAQGHDLVELPTCHSLAEACREDKMCRIKLEHYEQSCAVDSMTKKCAGPPADCRRAMLGILGTELRSNCACKGTDLTQLYDCLGWQRLLWVNPCVVESQKDFHARKKHHHHSHLKTTTSTEVWSTSATFIATTPTITETVDEDNVIPEVTKIPSSTFGEITSIVDSSSSSSSSISASSSSSGITISTTTATTTVRYTTPSTTTTSTTPPRFCVVQRPRQNHQYIREGKGKRLYREDEPECSELCQCGEGEVLVCNTICVESSPCKTNFAFYNHAAPAYQAYRGRCLCYSGRFICMRPSPDSYSIPHGVFMFLGYSETDENLLKTHNNQTVLDAVDSLDHFIRDKSGHNQTVCTLFLYNMTRENVIAVARLGGDNLTSNSTPAETLRHLLRIKEECGGRLQDLSEKINNKHQEVHTHPLLSIFKMAEVEVKLPPPTSGKSQMSSQLILITVSILIVKFINLLTNNQVCQIS